MVVSTEQKKMTWLNVISKFQFSIKNQEPVKIGSLKIPQKRVQFPTQILTELEAKPVSSKAILSLLAAYLDGLNVTYQDPNQALFRIFSKTR